MSTPNRPLSHPAAAARLTAAIAAVPLPVTPQITISTAPPPPPAKTCPNPPFPAQSRQNPPKPATHPPIWQNEPRTDEEVRQFIDALRAQSGLPPVRAARPAQTRHNLPQPATSPPKKQNEPIAEMAQPAPPATLQPRQLLAARLLLAGQTARAIAAQLGVDRHTISDWKKRPDFQQEIHRLLTPAANMTGGRHVTRSV